MVRIRRTGTVSDLHDVIVVILAGGKGTRLGELTRRMPKPGVPFAGKQRIIDFSLWNALHSGADRILILSQYGHDEISDHVEALGLTSVPHGKRVSVIPPTHYEGQSVYTHTANAVFQNINRLRQHPAHHVLILSGDHVYKMDYRPMLQRHVTSGADFTVCSMGVTREEAQHFGILQVDDAGVVRSFREKPKDLSEEREYCASLGIYVADKDVLIDVLTRDAADTESNHDFGGDIIPALIRGDYGTDKVVGSYSFGSHVIEGENGPYWRDVGRLTEYLDAHLDLVAVRPVLNMYNRHWPIMSAPDGEPGMKVTPLPDVQGWTQRRHAFTAAGGTVLDWPFNLERVVIGRRVHIGEQSDIVDSVIHSDVHIGRHVMMKRVIVMERAIIPDGTTIGFDAKQDESRGYKIYADDGIVIVPSPEYV